jgi:hypothetical protein
MREKFNKVRAPVGLVCKQGLNEKSFDEPYVFFGSKRGTQILCYEEESTVEDLLTSV